MQRPKFAFKMMSPLIVAMLIIPLVSFTIQSSISSYAAEEPPASNSPAATTLATPQQSSSVATSKRPEPQQAMSQASKSATSRNKTARGRGKHHHQSKTTTTTTSTTPSPEMSLDPYNQMLPKELRMMLGFNNTPPLFVTSTRDFYVDVARHSLGSKITTITASDQDGDKIEYSLEAANARDASPYFAINPISGELKLANRQFAFVGPIEQQVVASDNDSSDSDDPEPDDKAASVGEAESEKVDSSSRQLQPADQQANEQRLSLELASPNLYFLNVAAFDGQYQSVLELKIHVYNSSYIFALQSANGGKPVQLTPDGSRKSNERLEGIIKSKANEFYASLQNQFSPLAGGHKSVVVYPDFMNPPLVKPTQEDEVSILPSPPTTTSSILPTPPNADQMLATQARPTSVQQPPQPQLSMIGTMGPVQQAPAEQTLFPQPVIVSLVVICLCLMLALVILIFIVPISVKRLRRQLKHVQRQHDHLSQRDSHGSTTMCSSSGASSISGHQKQGGFASNLSQFTLTSDRSMAGRQSSLDSNSTGAQTMMSNDHQHHHRRHYPGQGSVPNPMYLNHSNQHFLHHQLVQPPTFTVFAQQAQPYIMRAEPQTNTTPLTTSHEIYYPLEDEFYSTINTESVIQETPSLQDTSLHYPIARDHLELQTQAICGTQSNYQMTECAPPLATARDQAEDVSTARPIESRNSDSGSSTRSLARFLSLPARHFRQIGHNSLEVEDLIDGLDSGEKVDFSMNVRTIARSSQIDRDNNNGRNISAMTSSTWELERDRLKFLEILGEGQFGLVWRCMLNPSGMARRHQNQNTSQVVAVKTLKKSAAQDERGQEELLAEIELMKSVCNHPNVVKILHCCTSDNSNGLIQNKPILLVMEYVELGKLQTFLAKSRNSHHYTTSLYSDPGQEAAVAAAATGDPLTSRDLVKFIYHVAKGMEYVSSKCIVHRDLASRNILVNSQRICKIGDFGMARHLQSLSGVYERHSRNTKIPVRWMAPEVILNNEFTTKSDVYSFGILMWEIVTLGSTPYRHLKTEQVKQEVAIKGERPDKPNYCHSMLYTIMSKCWLENPNERPTFSWLVGQFDELLLSANDYIELDQYPDHNYYNICKNSAPYELL